ncbi:MAG: DNA alkylation repair protein [Planctomycetes bacterium]|nr:DNA alkylation repair protein [Planctomycetota bacterium]
MTKSEVITLLAANKNERGIEHWKKLGDRAGGLKGYGIGLTKLRKLAKQVGRDHTLAQQLWKSKVYDAKVIGLLIDDPKKLTREQVEEQVESLPCGMLTHVFATCGATLTKTPYAFDLASDWTQSKDEVRRCCGYLMLYDLAKSTKHKAFGDPYCLACIKHIQASIHQESSDVKEAMNATLIGIGKHNVKLNKAAIRAVKAIGPLDIDYPDSNCEPINVMKHLTSDYLRKKLGT